jgi:hypothetical protein
MFHEGWVRPDGNLLLITVDGPWDPNLAGGVNAEMPPINRRNPGLVTSSQRRRQPVGYDLPRRLRAGVRPRGAFMAGRSGST